MADITPIKRVKLKLRAGISGFDTEPDMTDGGILGMPTSAVVALKTDPVHLLALQVRDDGMSPMFFEDDWVVIDTKDTALRSSEVYALNWNGEAWVSQLTKDGGQWYLRYTNPEFKPINVRSGQFNIVGRVVYQPGRVVTGRL